MEFCKIFFRIVFFIGGIFMLIVSIMAFSNMEALKIKKGKHTQSGIMLIITSAVSYIIHFFIYFIIFHIFYILAFLCFFLPHEMG